LIKQRFDLFFRPAHHDLERIIRQAHCNAFALYPGARIHTLRALRRWSRSPAWPSRGSARSQTSASDYGIRTAANAMAMGSNPSPMMPAV
jgi:hypothetical protein